jgi:hypothetical protein
MDLNSINGLTPSTTIENITLRGCSLKMGHLGPWDVGQLVMECIVKELFYVNSLVRNHGLPCVSCIGHRGHIWRL